MVRVLLYPNIGHPKCGNLLGGPCRKGESYIFYVNGYSRCSHATDVVAVWRKNMRGQNVLF